MAGLAGAKLSSAGWMDEGGEGSILAHLGSPAPLPTPSMEAEEWGTRSDSLHHQHWCHSPHPRKESPSKDLAISHLHPLPFPPVPRASPAIPITLCILQQVLSCLCCLCLNPR